MGRFWHQLIIRKFNFIHFYKINGAVIFLGLEYITVDIITVSKTNSRSHYLRSNFSLIHFECMLSVKNFKAFLTVRISCLYRTKKAQRKNTVPRLLLNRSNVFFKIHLVQAITVLFSSRELMKYFLLIHFECTLSIS